MGNDPEIHSTGEKNLFEIEGNLKTRADAVSLLLILIGSLPLSQEMAIVNAEAVMEAFRVLDITKEEMREALDTCHRAHDGVVKIQTDKIHDTAEFN